MPDTPSPYTGLLAHPEALWGGFMLGGDSEPIVSQWCRQDELPRLLRDTRRVSLMEVFPQDLVTSLPQADQWQRANEGPVKLKKGMRQGGSSPYFIDLGSFATTVDQWCRDNEITKVKRPVNSHVDPNIFLPDLGSLFQVTVDEWHWPPEITKVKKPITSLLDPRMNPPDIGSFAVEPPDYWSRDNEITKVKRPINSLLDPVPTLLDLSTLFPIELDFWYRPNEGPVRRYKSMARLSVLTNPENKNPTPIAADILTVGTGTWVCPDGVTSVVVEVWGGGGSGGGGDDIDGGGCGGGGGAYSRKTVTVVPGTGYPYTVGAGGIAPASTAGTVGSDSWFSSSSTVMAKGGGGGGTGLTGAGGLPGLAVAGFGDTKYSGGAGGGSFGGTAEGGGSSAGTDADGNTTLTITGATGVGGGGKGGDGMTTTVNGSVGGFPGGGGGGGPAGFQGSSGKGRNGGNGKITITYFYAAVPGTDWHRPNEGVRRLRKSMERLTVLTTPEGKDPIPLVVERLSVGSGLWHCPDGVTSVVVECWAGGGGGGKASLAVGGGTGGGGGGYSRRTVIVVPGNDYSYSVGGGGAGGTSGDGVDGSDTWFSSVTNVFAKGGGKGHPNNNLSGGAGGSSTLGFGDVKRSGGSGGVYNESSFPGGGGGSSAGTDANGTSASSFANSSAGGAAPAAGGNGGRGYVAGVPTPTVGEAGAMPGGGGGASGVPASGAIPDGYAGGDGTLTITYLFTPINAVDTWGRDNEGPVRLKKGMRQTGVYAGEPTNFIEPVFIGPDYYSRDNEITKVKRPITALLDPVMFPPDLPTFQVEVDQWNSINEGPQELKKGMRQTGVYAGEPADDVEPAFPYPDTYWRENEGPKRLHKGMRQSGVYAPEPADFVETVFVDYWFREQEYQRVKRPITALLDPVMLALDIGSFPVAPDQWYQALVVPTAFRTRATYLSIAVDSQTPPLVFSTFSGVLQRGTTRLSLDALTGYTLYVGVDTLPDFTQEPAATTVSLPFSYVITPPVSGTRTFYSVVRQRNAYGLESRNQKPTLLTIDSSGQLVRNAIPAPTGVTAFAMPNDVIRVLAKYPTVDLDEYPATDWRVWIGVTEPDPDVDTPTTDFDVDGNSMMVNLDSYTAGTYFIVVALYRQADGEQTAADAITLIVPEPPDTPESVHGGTEVGDG